MGFESFELEQVAFEIKYERAWLIWDRHGQLWTRLRNRLDNLEFVEAGPNRSRFKVGSEYEFVVELERAFTTQHRPGKGLRDFIDAVEKFVPVIIEELAIASLVRVGCRLVYTRRCEDAAEAVSIIDGAGLLVPQVQAFLDIPGPPSGLELVSRFQDESLGATLRIRSEKREFTFEPPSAVPDLERVTKKWVVLVVDVDRYTSSQIDPGFLSAREFISESLQTIKRDCNSLI